MKNNINPKKILDKLNSEKLPREDKTQLTITKDLSKKIKAKFTNVSELEKAIELVHDDWLRRKNKEKEKG